LKGKATLKVIEAEHGQEAIDLLLKHDIDIVLMDVQMPMMNGFEATSVIRKLNHETKKNVPSVALTASVLRTDLDKCKQAGMNSYIPKPFKTHDLIAGIAEVLDIELRTIDTVSKKEQTQSETLTNLDFLTDFCEGDRVKMKKYVNMLLNMADALDTQIRTAMKGDDPLDLADQVHGLITKFIMMGMEDSKSLSIAIENKLRDDGNVEDVVEDVEILMSQLKLGMEELGGFRP
jgi:CheY-like chemotaxis protein